MGLHIEQGEREGTIVPDREGPPTLGHGDLELRDREPALDQTGKFFDSEQDAVNGFFPDREIQRFDILSFVRAETGCGSSQ